MKKSDHEREELIVATTFASNKRYPTSDSRPNITYCLSFLVGGCLLESQNHGPV